VFEGISSSVSRVCQEVEKEPKLCCLARNTALHKLLGRARRLNALELSCSGRVTCVCAVFTI
jgi:hypothetical protein